MFHRNKGYIEIVNLHQLNPHEIKFHRNKGYIEIGP